MTEDNVVSIQDDLNLAMTVQQIRDFEKLLLETKGFKSTWLYLIVDGMSGRYVCTLEGGNELRFMGQNFIKDLQTDGIRLYELEEAAKLCQELNMAIPDTSESKVLFAPVSWRRLCIIHLASLYDVVQKMDAKGKTKRFFASC
jgi:2,3-bisphosphoglycerate-independent phosphoglycerate mutase